MSRNQLALVAALGLGALGGCGLDALGVTAIDVALTPVAVTSPPATYPADVLPLASGHVHATPPTGAGEVLVSGLPIPGTGLVYRVWLGFAASERALFPGTVVETMPVGHVHGALRPEHGEDTADAGASTSAVVSNGTVTAVPVGDLASLGGSAWKLTLAENKLGKWKLATVRAAAIVLTATSTTVRTAQGPFSGATLLAGRAGAAGAVFDPAPTGAAHQHGADAGAMDVGSADSETTDLGDAGVADAGGHVHGDR